MNKTKQFNAEEKYVSPAAKVVEISLDGILCQSNTDTMGVNLLHYSDDDE